MSDVDGKVTGLQGNPVKVQTLGSPEDGYDLTWKDGYWQALPKTTSSGGLRKEYFISDGYWTCPNGVTNILIVAAGGGGGGSGAATGECGSGGGGSFQQTTYVSVTPGQSYFVKVGAGGAGGARNPIVNSYASNGSAGESTSFSLGSTKLFSCVGAGGGAAAQSNSTGYGGASFPRNPTIGGNGVDPKFPGYGGDAQFYSGTVGMYNYINTYSGGAKGTNFGVGVSSWGSVGSGGGAGPQGNGAQGGFGAGDSTAANGGDGSNAGANTGAGGGGGGATAASGKLGGNGGNGGSGYLYIIY